VRTTGLADELIKLLENRFSMVHDALHVNFDPIYLMAASFDPNTAHLLDETELELAVSSIQGLVIILDFTK
jgi:hypothetical protein